MATAALDRSFTRLNPVTGETATTAPAFGIDQANAAVDAAAKAFPAWSALGPNARRAALNTAADKLAAGCLRDQVTHRMIQRTEETTTL